MERPKCGTCPFWEKVNAGKWEPPPGTPKEILETFKGRSVGLCCGNPPTVFMRPVMAQAGIMGPGGQQNVMFVPDPQRPPMLDNASCCHLHPSASVWLASFHPRSDPDKAVTLTEIDASKPTNLR